MTKGDEQLSAQVNCALQSIVGSLVLLVWQVVYTRPRFDSLIQQPMKIVHTSNTRAVCILLSIGGEFHSLHLLLSHKQVCLERLHKCRCDESLASSAGLSGDIFGLLWSNGRGRNVLFVAQVCVARHCCVWSLIVWESDCSSGQKGCHKGRSQRATCIEAPDRRCDTVP